MLFLVLAYSSYILVYCIHLILLPLIMIKVLLLNVW